MTDRVLYCRGPGRDGNPCELEVSGHGDELCSSHRRQLSRTGKLAPIAEKISPREHLINLWDRCCEADDDDEAEIAERAFWTQAKAILKANPDDTDIADLVRKARSEATRRGMAGARAQGKHVGRPRLAIDPAEVARLLALPPLELVALMLRASKRSVYRALSKGTLLAKPPRAAKRHAANGPRPARESPLMPLRSLKPCATVGCVALVRGVPRCPACTREGEARRRTTQGNPYNNPRWRAIRKSWLESHPLCAECEKTGRVEPASVCDHIDPHKGDRVKFWSGPFQSLCASCHSRKTAVSDGGFGNPVAR